MPFLYPATEIFDADGARRVVWSVEEYAEAIADGYADASAVEPSPALLQETQDDPAPVKRGPGRPKKGGDPVANVIDSTNDHQ